MSDPLQFLNTLHDDCAEMLGDVTFNKALHKDGLLVGTYASLIELTGGILVLVHNDRYSALSPVFRAFLETYVDFKNLSSDPDYLKHAYAKHHVNWIKLFTNDRPNPYLADIRAHKEFEGSLRRHEEELAVLQKQGFGALKARDRFERADMLEVYESIYHFESDGVHNSLQAFINRHVELGEETFTLALYKDRSPDEYTSRLDTTAALLLDATEKLHQRLKSKHLAWIGDLKKQFEGLRSKYLDPTD